MIDYSLLPNYCSVRNKSNDIERAEKNNKEALRLLRSITFSERTIIKDKFKIFKEETIKNANVSLQDTQLAQALSFFKKYVFVEEIDKELKDKIEGILNNLTDLDIVPELIAECRGFNLYKYLTMLKRLVLPYKTSIAHLVNLFVLCYDKMDNDINFGSGQIFDIQPIEIKPYESPKTTNQPPDDKI